MGEVARRPAAQDCDASYLRLAVGAPVVPSPRKEGLSVVRPTSVELLTAAPGVKRLVSEADGTGGSESIEPGDAHPTMPATAISTAATQSSDRSSMSRLRTLN